MSTDKCNEHIQSILTGIQKIMQAIESGKAKPVEAMTESQLHAIDDMVWGTVDVIEEGK